MNHRHTWLRWIAVLPISATAYIASYFLLRLLSIVQMLFNSDGGTWYIKYVVPILASGFSGYAYILAGSSMAPNFKKNTALSLLLLMTLVIGAAIFSSILLKKYMGVIEGVGTVVGMMICFFELKEKNKLE